MALKDVSVKFNADTTGLSRGLKQVEAGITKVKSGLSSLVKTGLGLAGIAAGIAGLVTLMDKYRGLRNSVQRTNELFRDSVKHVTYFASTTARSFGMAETTAYEYAMTFGNLFKTMTRGSEENAKVTIATMKATAVISSKTGRTMEDVGDRIRSGILGNTEAIESLGIYANLAMIKTTKAFKQIAGSKSWDQLTYQQQQQIRTLAILEQAQKQYGNSVSQISGMSLPRLGQAFKDLITHAGMLINAGLQPLLNMLGKLAYAATAALKAIASLLGLDLAGGVVPGIEAQDQFADATEDATKALNKQKKALAGFDELNVLSQPDEAATGGGTGGIMPSPWEEIPELPEPPTDLGTGPLEKKLRAFLALFDFTPIKEAWANLKSSLKPIWDALGEGLSWLWNEVLVPLGQWTIGEAVPAFLDLLAGYMDYLGGRIEAIRPLYKWLWDSFLKPLAAWTGGVIVNVLRWVGDALSNIGSWMKEHKGIVQTFEILTLAFAAAWLLVNGAVAAWNVIAGIATGVTGAFGSVMTFITSPIGMVTAAIAAVIAIGVLLYKNWDTVKEHAVKLWGDIKEVFGKIVGFFEGIWDGIKKGFVGFVNFVIDGINTLIKGFLWPFNQLIKGWNSSLGWLLGEIPELRVEIPKIPALAKGGEVDRPTVALIGEAGREAVVPLGDGDFKNDMAAAMATAMLQVAQLTRGDSGGGQDTPQEAVLEVDGVKLARVMLPKINSELQRMGYKPILA